ncbi:hypothetical protein PG997_011321 [Apiospora hydei]|uniref:Uncharacterized protein n=1 Tax=Apiospora hydei TaxID=1337664 RepID=A0ABR1VMP9_9PEZI
MGKYNTTAYLIYRRKSREPTRAGGGYIGKRFLLCRLIIFQCQDVYSLQDRNGHWRSGTARARRRQSTMAIQGREKKKREVL